MSGKAIHTAKDPAARWADPQPKPAGYVPPQATLVDEMLAGKKTPREVAGAIIEEAYGPLKQHCALPVGFANRVLEYEQRDLDQMTDKQLDELNYDPPSAIIDPRPAQIEAVELLKMYLQGHFMVCRNRDPFQPIFGVNFVGPPGCGKTHIMSAFARSLKEYLDGKLADYRGLVSQFVNREYLKYQHTLARSGHQNEPHSVWELGSADGTGEELLLGQLKQQSHGDGTEQKPPSLLALTSNLSGGLVERKDPASQFLGKLAELKNSLAKLHHQPSDFLYLDFDALWELCRSESTTREEALEAITRAKVVFLDDVHPKGDAERAQIVLHVIEGRYTAGRMGTFVTTNLTTKELAGSESHIAERLESRCSEMFYEIDFTDCIDWRVRVKHRRIELAKEYLRASIAALKKQED